MDRMDNIYANAGRIIEDRYVSRTQAEQEIISRVLANQNSGSLSLVGLHRTGKSSILHNLFLKDEVKEKLLRERKMIVVKMNLTGFSRAARFFHALVKETYHAVSMVREGDEKLLDMEYEAASGWTAESGSICDIEDYMEALHDLGFRTVAVVDEFDYAMTLFSECPQCFNYLRELAYRPEYGLDIVTASRRSLKEISDTATRGVSPFPNIFKFVHVGPFNEAERQEYRDIFTRHYGDNVLKDKDWQEMESLTGGLAYWMDLLMDYLVQRLAAGGTQLSVKQLYEEQEDAFYERYQEMEKLLDEQKLLDPLVQYEFGPLESATKGDRVRLESYGVIRIKRGANQAESEERTQIQLFSDGFREYLRVCQTGYDFSRLWCKVEKRLREALLRHLRMKYKGGKWEDVLRDKYNTQEPWMDLPTDKDVEKQRDKMEGKHIGGEITFLELTKTSALFRIITDEWEGSGNVAGMQAVFPGLQPEDWGEISGRLSEARNDNLHNAFHFLPETDRTQTQHDLTRLSSAMDKWEAGRR